MGIFSGDVAFLGQTEIFVCELADGRHATIYSAELEVDQDCSITLPVPARQNSESPVNFEWLPHATVSAVFDILSQCFDSTLDRLPRQVLPMAEPDLLFSSSLSSLRETAGVLAPNPKILNSLPAYWDFAFAVLHLKKSWGRFRIAPFGYAYEPARPNKLFYPVAHIDCSGRIDHMTEFDHTLYYQQSIHFGHINGWDNAIYRPEVMLGPQSLWPSHLLDARHAVQRQLFYGNLPNCDSVLRSTRIVDAEVRAPWDLLRGRTSRKTKLWELLPDETGPLADAEEPAS